jgi:hypothetical protein
MALTICCGTAVKRMGMLGVGVRKLKVKADRFWHAFCINYV